MLEEEVGNRAESSMRIYCEGEKNHVLLQMVTPSFPRGVNVGISTKKAVKATAIQNNSINYPVISEYPLISKRFRAMQWQWDDWPWVARASKPLAADGRGCDGASISSTRFACYC
jgi:hypothetical protein